MAAYRRVYDSRHLQADCQKPGSAPELYTRVRATFFYISCIVSKQIDEVWQFARVIQVSLTATETHIADVVYANATTIFPHLPSATDASTALKGSK